MSAPASFGPGEERLSRVAEGGDPRVYDVAFRRVKLVTWLFIGMVVAATYMMVARTPGGASDGSSDRPGTSLAQQAGCLSCHRIGSDGNARPGGDLSAVGAGLTPPEIRVVLLDPPSGMPAYDDLPADELDALVGYLSGLR